MKLPTTVVKRTFKKEPIKPLLEKMVEEKPSVIKKKTFHGDMEKEINSP